MNYGLYKITIRLSLLLNLNYQKCNLILNYLVSLAMTNVIPNIDCSYMDFWRLRFKEMVIVRFVAVAQALFLFPLY